MTGLHSKAGDRQGLDRAASLGSECVPFKRRPLPHSVAGKLSSTGRASGLWKVVLVKRSLRGFCPWNVRTARQCLSPRASPSRDLYLAAGGDADMFQDVSAHQVLKNGHYQMFASSLRPRGKL